MRPDWVGEYTRDQQRAFRLICYPSVSWSELVLGRRIAEPYDQLRQYLPGQLATGSDDVVYRCTSKVVLLDPTADEEHWSAAVAEDYELPAGVDYTDVLEQASHTSQELTFEMVALSADSVLPGPGDLLVVQDEPSGQRLFVAQVEQIESRSLSRGQRRVSGTARSRDASPLWRSSRWSTNVYPVGTELGAIATDILKSLRLSRQEYARLQPAGRWTPHTNTQLGDMTAWEMLSEVLFPVLQEPWIDALGRFVAISRDVRRDADLELEPGDVISIDGSQSALPTTSMLVRWLDRDLKESVQQTQALGQGQVTAGYFQLTQHINIWWSKDRTQRAKNTSMKILQSANGAELSFCEERYEQVDPFHGRVTVETSAEVPVLIVTLIAAVMYSWQLGDIVVSAGFIVSGGYTIRVGSVIGEAALLALAAVMRQMGTGSYEVWGQPYDYVHQMNVSEAYVPGSRPWEAVQEEVESDFIADEPHAQQVAVAELLYRRFAASRYSATIVDRPALERGDILLLPGGVRFYCTDYRRELRRGAAAVLNVEGFRV